MSTQRQRQGRATATVGLTGVAGAGALRHVALDRAYGQEKRPALVAERRFLRRARTGGRARYVAGAVLGAVSAPAAVTGVYQSLNKADDRQHPGFVRTGLQGARRAATQRAGNTHPEPGSRRLVAGNYVASAAAGSATGGIVHRLLANRVPGAARAGLAGVAAVSLGAATLPLQAKATQRASHGAYTVTPSGVKRARQKPVRPSSQATLSTRVGKLSTLSPSQKRARVAASGGAPFIGDFAQAATAARLAPHEQRRGAAALTYGGNQSGAITGQVVGAYGAAALARRSPSFDAKAKHASGQLDRAANFARSKVNLKPTGEKGPGRVARAMASSRTPRAVKAAARPLLHNPKVAALGALALGGPAGQLGAQAGYGAQLRREAHYKPQNPSARHGSRVAKLQTPAPLTQRDKKTLAHRKEHSAALSMIGGATGLGAIGALGLSRVHPKLRRLKSLQTPLLTAGAGVGGVNAFVGAKVQRKEAQQTLAKALVPTGVRRAPAMRRGFVRQTRLASGMTRVSSVRGGLA